MIQELARKILKREEKIRIKQEELKALIRSSIIKKMQKKF